ncbi:MAG TPA: response regulator, partial [Steroidobacteraceae bacterium]
MNAAIARLLIVDDEAAHLRALCDTLQPEGYATRGFSSGQQALAALRTGDFDLLLTDLMMPEMDGITLINAAKQIDPTLGAIVMTGHGTIDTAVRAMQGGALDYILKPFKLNVILPIISRALDVQRLRRENSALHAREKQHSAELAALREASLRAERRQSEQLRREQEERLRRLTRTYRMLSSTSSAILRLHNRPELLDELCRIAVQQGGYQRTAISLLDSNTKTLTQTACAGLDSEPHGGTDYLMDTFGPQADLMENVMRTGTPIVHNDLHRAGPDAQFRESAILLGYRSIAALPLVIDSATVGVIRLFSKEPDVFDASEVGVLLELTANISFALQYLEKDEAVHFLSHFDSLTGLAKRPLFCRRLAQILAKDAENGASHTVVVFDVQKLGAINDSFGRYVGDSLIEKIATRLKQTYADSECVGYFGGGTFVVTLPNRGNDADTGIVLHSAAAPLFIDPFHIDGQEMRPTIRSGVAFFPHDAKTADALVQNAEAALKAARADNEKYMLYGLVTQRPTSRSLALEARLTRALERNEFLLHYQPKIDIKSGKIEGLEALLRWRDSEDGLVPPSVFIPLLEQSGAIVDVGEWVFLQAHRDSRDWSAAGLPT